MKLNIFSYADAHDCNHPHRCPFARDRVLLGCILPPAILSSPGSLGHRSRCQHAALLARWCCDLNRIRPRRHARQEVPRRSVVRVVSHDHRVWADDDARQPLVYVRFLYPFIRHYAAGSNRPLQRCEGILAVDRSAWRGLLVPGASYCVASSDAVEGHGYEHGHIWILEDAGRISRHRNRPGYLV